MKATLQILAEDILNSRYSEPDYCAITCAFRRTNLNMREGGGAILDKNYRFIMRTPKDLLDKVKAMYKFVDASGWDQNQDAELVPIEPINFEYELEIPNQKFKPSHFYDF
jgi:hypothetical protein